MSEVSSAFVLAAGEGKRLRPLTSSTPKPLLPIRGSKSILEWNLEQLQLVGGLKKVVINAWYLAEQVEAFVDRVRERFSFEIVCLREEELLGTGGGLKNASSHLLPGPFLMLNGDCVWKGKLQDFVLNSLNEKGDIFWWLCDQRVDQTQIGYHSESFDIVRIGKLWDKNEGHEAQACFSGIQLIKNLSFNSLPNKGCYIRKFLLSELDGGLKLKANRQLLEFWEDLGTPERYRSFQQ